MVNYNDLDVIVDSQGFPVSQYYNEKHGEFAVETTDGSVVLRTDVDFRLKNLILDSDGFPLPQLWDPKKESFVPRTASNNSNNGGNGGVSGEELEALDEKISSIGNVAESNLLESINNTPNGGRLILKSKEIYNLNSDIFVDKDIVIEGNNATIKTLGDKKLVFDKNVEIYNTTFERTSIYLMGNNSKVKIINNKFKNSYDNAIDSWGDFELLVIKDNEIEGTIVSEGNNKNFNNSGSFVYLNSGEIKFLQIKNNRIYNVMGGTVIFLGGYYHELDISDNVIDTMAQRAIGFWYNRYAKGEIARNKIYKCGFLKPPGLGPGGEGAGVGCNAIYAIGENAKNVDVIDNHIEFVYENGIEGTYKSVKRNTIIGTGMDLENYPTPSYEAIFIMGDNAVIEDNTIINPKGHGIYKFEFDANKIGNYLIRRNNISSEGNNEYSAICFRTAVNTEYENLIIEDNYVKNHSTVIEIPNGKTYKNVKIGNNTAINYTRVLSDFFGVGIDANKCGVFKKELISNGNFEYWTPYEWDVTTGYFDDWSYSNARLELVSDGSERYAKVIAEDNYNGRIIQSVSGFKNPSSIVGKRLSQLSINIKGSEGLQLRYYQLTHDGFEVPGTAAWFYSDLSETDFSLLKVLLPYYPNFKLEIANAGGVGNWLEINEVSMSLLEI